MERLTVWNDKTEGAELISWDEEEWKDFMGSLDVPICTELSLAVDKLAEYEDLEEKLEKVYGKCDGLLETAINSLVRHEGAEIGTPAKARLLTDEDVDKWESFKDAEEQGLILRLREPLTDDLRKELDKYVK